MTAIAASRSASVASGEARIAAARACCMARRTPGSFSCASARSSAGRAAGSRDLNTASAALARASGSGENSIRLPIAASIARRTALLTRTGFEVVGVDVGDRLAGAGVDVVGAVGS